MSIAPKLANRWIVWRLFPGLAWLWLVVAILQLGSTETVSPHLLWVILIPLATLAYIGLFNSALLAVGYILTLLLFPFLAFGWIVYKTLSPARWIALVNSTTKTPIALLYFVALAIGNIVISAIGSHDAILIIGYGMVTLQFALLICAIRWAITPVNILNFAIAALDIIRAELDKNNTTIQPETDPLKKLNKLSETKKWWEYTDAFLTKVHTNTPTIISVSFIVLFLLLLACVVVTYSSIYHASQRCGMFPGLSPTYLHSLLYSFSVVTTSPISTVQTPNTPEQLLYCCELGCTVLLLTLFVSLFSIGLGLHQDTISKFRLKIEDARRYAQAKAISYLRQISDAASGPPPNETTNPTQLLPPASTTPSPDAPPATPATSPSEAASTPPVKPPTTNRTRKGKQ